ncbi:Pentatricopeptide repeat-containing protein [Thalictrum thalictroides]|uniref:Pentatricopeptide repeat-containing protein n=1 Tax=Thalictrum thalictroides TaxID=46969 RepID=A0A7J6X6V8_THATH|nr:Pentatricopeptide repeat-containing protein [Thalictrum thalictroides]
MENPETALLALKFFLNKLKKPTKQVILYNVTMKVFRKCRNFDKAEILFEEMIRAGVKPDNITFTTIISCARMCNLPNKAVELFEKMKDFECKPDDVTYSAMIDAYGRAGNVDLALSLYDRARTEKWRIDAVTFATLIKIYGKSGNFDGVLNVYEEMKALGVKPNLVVYNTLLDAMGRAKRPWQAKSIYKDMINNGLEPSSSTYAAILRAYCRSRYGEDALIIYREMKAKGVGLNVILYNSMLAMCADIGYIDQSVEIYDDMKRSKDCKPDSWTYSSLITMYSCSGKVMEAENVLNEMLEAGFEPNIFVLTSLIQCYGKANRTDDVVKSFNRLQELGITPDDRFCGCLLNVMTQIPKEELGKLVECIQQANTKLGYVVTLLMEKDIADGVFKEKANELFGTISKEVRKAYCNCLIDLCVNLNLLDKACELLDLGLTLGIYTDIQSKSPNQWSLQLKSLSLGAAITALHVWMNDLSKALENGEELPPLLGINTGHGKHKYSEKGLASVLESHLKEMNSPFHDDPDKVGWFLTTKVAAKSWLESRKSPELVAA